MKKWLLIKKHHRMKLILLLTFLLLCSLSTKSQNFKKDTLIVGEVHLLPGDTIHLGYGSGANKQFVFVHWRPGVMTYDLGSGPQGIEAIYANAFVIYGGVKWKKFGGKSYPDANFYLNGTKIRVMVMMTNALGVGEVKGFGVKK